MVAVVLLAVPSAWGSCRCCGGPVIAASLGALSLTAAAIASPSARTHGGADHGHADEAADGHGHEDPAGGRRPRSSRRSPTVRWVTTATVAAGRPRWPSRRSSPPTSAPCPSSSRSTAPLVAVYPTLADAEAAGYRQAGPFSPGLGIDYNPPTYSSTNGDGVMDVADIANVYPHLRRHRGRRPTGRVHVHGVPGDRAQRLRGRPGSLALPHRGVRGLRARRDPTRRSVPT